MSKPIKRVLLTNDDGWRGPGLKILEEIAEQIADEVWIISPDLDQSGVSMSITLHSGSASVARPVTACCWPWAN